jgi:REP element-mobilizing transposase RayT
MPRKPRSEFAAAVYHVSARGNRRQAIYLDVADREAYLGRFSRLADKLSWRCLSYCLMTNHVHLLVDTSKPNLGEGMRLLHGGFAQGFNRRHGFVGHVFQGRFHAVPIETDAQLWLTAAYIARNPVEGRLCGAATDWPWSSHRAIVSDDAPRWLDRQRLLQYFGAHGAPNPLERYQELVARPGTGDSPLNACPLNAVAFSWDAGRLKIEVDGRDLIELVREVELPFATAEGRPEHAGAYHGPPAEHVRRGARQFLPARKHLTAQLLGCECGEPDCRPLLAEIELGRETVSWSRFRRGRRADWSHDRLGPFVFSRSAYEKALAALQH